MVAFFLEPREIAAPLCSRVLNLVPRLRVDDSGMLPVIDLPLVPDPPGIDRVAENVMEMTAVERNATGHPTA